MRHVLLIAVVVSSSLVATAQSGGTFTTSVKPRDAGPHEHCWHGSDVQHAVAYHSDSVCCHCGESRCESLPRPDMSGHGAFAPELGSSFGTCEPIGDSGVLRCKAN